MARGREKGWGEEGVGEKSGRGRGAKSPTARPGCGKRGESDTIHCFPWSGRPFHGRAGVEDPRCGVAAVEEERDVTYRRDRHSNSLPSIGDLSVPFTLRSPFLASCGLDDSFSSPEELDYTSTPLVSIQHELIPILSLPPRLNAYALDFYKHGQQQAIALDNGLTSSTFERLTGWKMLLVSLVAAVERRGERVEMKKLLLVDLKAISEVFSENMREAFGDYR